MRIHIPRVQFGDVLRGDKTLFSHGFARRTQWQLVASGHRHSTTVQRLLASNTAVTPARKVELLTTLFFFCVAFISWGAQRPLPCFNWTHLPCLRKVMLRPGSTENWYGCLFHPYKRSSVTGVLCVHPPPTRLASPAFPVAVYRRARSGPTQDGTADPKYA